MGDKLSRARISSHRELEVYKMAFETAMKIFELSKGFSKEEKYSLTDQIRDLRDQSVRISPRRFSNENTLRLL